MCFPPAVLRHCLKHEDLRETALAVVTVASDAVLPSADMLYVYGFCGGSAIAAVEVYNRRFSILRFPAR
jgi:hypothetical protein